MYDVASVYLNVIHEPTLTMVSTQAFLTLSCDQLSAPAFITALQQVKKCIHGIIILVPLYVISSILSIYECYLQILS